LKKKKSEKKSHIGPIIAVAVIIAIIAAGIYYYYQQKMSEQNNTSQWVISGPFAITKEKYRLGDNVFMVVQGLKPNDAGKIVVFDPKGGVFTQVPFNGTMKSDFNYVFKPNTVRAEKLCKPEDLVGNWSIAFQGAPYRPIPFQVINEWVQGSQAEITPINPC
jgi:hypothetical protein